MLNDRQSDFKCETTEEKNMTPLSLHTFVQNKQNTNFVMFVKTLIMTYIRKLFPNFLSIIFACSVKLTCQRYQTLDEFPCLV